MVTIYDIAKRANCSAMTVSRVINNTGRISDRTRARVLAIMNEMNYVPNEAARSLVRQETKLLSLLITDITNPFFTSVARGAEDAARQLGYRLLLANSDESVDKEREYMETILSMRVDGVLFAPTGDQSAANLEKLTERNVPIVLLDREVPDMACDIIQGDSLGGARQLMEHLIQLGHRRIAFINGSTVTSTARLRLEGYLESLKAHQIEANEAYIIEADYRQSDIEEQIHHMFGAGADGLETAVHSSEPPTAVFAANNFLALTAIRALRKLSIRVPDDVSVVCFDDLEASYVVDPFMTVIAQPAYTFGYQGIQMLVERIKQGPAQDAADWRRIVLQPELIVRRSAIERAGGNVV